MCFCLIISKVVDFKLVAHLTSKALMARFVAHCGKPSLILNVHGTNFVGADRELRKFADFL